MTLDPSYLERNRLSTQRIRRLAARLTEAEMLTPVGQHWTVAILFAHLAFWDRRVMYVLDKTKQDGVLFIPEIDIFVNDLSLPLWAAIPPREAARIAIQTAADLDRRLEAFPPALLAEIHAYNPRCRPARLPSPLRAGFVYQPWDSSRGGHRPRAHRRCARPFEYSCPIRGTWTMERGRAINRPPTFSLFRLFCS